jgi:hypothetical protein
MTRSVKIVISAMICGMVFTLIGCGKNDNLEIDDNLEIEDNLEIDECGKITVSLMERGDYAIFDKTVILYETDHYLIKTPLYHFFGSMNNLFGLDYGSFFFFF